MKLYIRILFGLIVMVLTSTSTVAQVRIEVPASNIINGTEFSTVQTVLNTEGNDKWKPSGINPTFSSVNSEYFTHTTLPGVTLPTSVLLWQLKSIGGERAPFRDQDVLPGFQWFSLSPKNWYEPHSTSGKYTAGIVAFTFKIPAEAFLNNTFIPGEYSLNVTHNYRRGGDVVFTPETFKVIIVIPSTNPIKWITNTPTKYYEISSLNQYRTGGTRTFDAIGPAEISNTINFNLWAKTATSTIQFTSSKGVNATRAVSLINLGSTHPKIITAPLSANWKNHTLNNPFLVVSGNKHNFALQMSISEADFKNHFFEAGTYKFQLNLDAKSTNNSVSATHNTDVTLKVLPLSEITIPTSGSIVNFQFNTAAQYQNGQTLIMPNQIKFSNNETYELSVKSATPYFTKEGIQSDILSSILQIGLVVGSNPLSTIPTKLIDGPPILDKNLDIKYTIGASAAQSLIGKEKSTYSIDIIYSFTAI